MRRLAVGISVTYGCGSTAAALTGNQTGTSRRLDGDINGTVADISLRTPQRDDGDAATSQLTPAIRSAIGHEPAAYRLAVFGILHGSDSQMVGALVRCEYMAGRMLTCWQSQMRCRAPSCCQSDGQLFGVQCQCQ